MMTGTNHDRSSHPIERVSRSCIGGETNKPCMNTSRLPAHISHSLECDATQNFTACVFRGLCIDLVYEWTRTRNRA